MCKVLEDYANERIMDSVKSRIKRMIEQGHTIDAVSALFNDVQKEIIEELYEEVTGKTIKL